MFIIYTVYADDAIVPLSVIEKKRDFGNKEQMVMPSEKDIENYLESLIKEMEFELQKLKKEGRLQSKLESLYIGGGVPSLM